MANGSKSNNDNNSNQCNPNNDAYWESRGYDERPDDWEERVAEDYEAKEGGQWK